MPNRFALFVPFEDMRLICTCDVCGSKRFERVFPASIEYFGGTVGDFHMASIVTLARREIAEELAKRFCGIDVRDIQMQEGESLWSEPGRNPIAAKRYDGPELAEIYFPLNVEGDPELSSLSEFARCDACGILSYEVKGVEKIMGGDEPREQFINGLNYHRLPWMGIRVRSSELGGAMAYRYDGGRPQVLEPVKNYIEERGWTNVEFVDYGVII